MGNKRNISELISKMTLEEKASLCSGRDFWNTKSIDRLDIPSVMVTDGPHGLRKQEGKADHLGLNESIEAICFPAACATACSFDIEMIEKMGEVLGEECQAENLSILLGPAVNIKRSPLCGRNFEYLSEDPYLTGKMAAAYIKGVQKWNVGTSIKHFAVNNQEDFRMNSSSELSERTLREIYLAGFEIAIKESQPKTVMCSYNKINGVYASENSYLMTDILRKEWNFEGYVMTDWGAIADRVEGLVAGVELEMPASGGYNDAKIVKAVREGVLDEAILNQAVERILKVTFSYADQRHSEAVFDRKADHQKAVEIETECAVLLENDGTLPLNSEQKILYVGEFAVKPRYQGGGSSHINASQVVSAMETAQAKGRNVTYMQGFAHDRDQAVDEVELQKIVDAAKDVDVVVIFAGLPDIIESEGYDRHNMSMPESQNRLIEAVSAVQSKTVVALHNGSPVEMPWADDVAAILELYLGGQGVGEASDRLLFGEVNPSGRLAETFPDRLEDTPSYLNFPGDGKKVEYAEGVYVGYRYYEAKKLPVRWAFGHGLSYTTFEYSNLIFSQDSMNDEETTITVNVDVMNTGAVSGKEVVQLYVSDRNKTPGRPLKELKGFKKIKLEPGEKKTVSMEISIRDLSYYDEQLKDWYAPSGTYQIQVGHASDDIRLTGELAFKTKRLLPFHVTGATTLGEVLKDPRTTALASQIITQMSSPEAGEQQESEASAILTQSIISGLPLKSLISSGKISGEEVEVLIKQLDACCQKD